MPKNMPAGPGIFWARLRGFKWWNLIVYIYGDAPFCKADTWDMNGSTMTVDADIMHIEEFGDMIAPAIPDVVGYREDWL